MKSIVPVHEKFVTDDQLKKMLTARSKTFINESVDYELVEKYQKQGWEIEKEFKTVCRLKKQKSVDMAFEDEVWSLFANLGFKILNKDRHLLIPYSDDEKSTQQIDVLAIDDETIIVIECKATAKTDKKRSFKTDIEALGGKKQGIINWLRKMFPNAKHKIKFALATQNFVLSQEDTDRLINFKILHIDEEAISYYQNLYEHLGVASKYQLLGNFFSGEEIPELDNTVAAIKGKMGNHTYYSFSIEPEKLLKIGFVLHKNKAMKKDMPTYQRMIKKARLRAIEVFINEGGYFGNSVIINIETSKELRFDRANTQAENSIAKVGVLYLPKKYKSAFIIDGQHRIYGYANTKYKSTNTIPVVAFENLDKKEQTEIFMQINENQKAIPKNLKNILNADLLWDSPNLTEAVKASRLQISIDLAEDKKSTFYGRIMVGEDIKTKKTCITTETISTALNKTNFFGKVSKDSIKEIGLFYNGNIEKAHDKLFNYLIACFDFIKESLPTEWELGEADNGYLSINATTYVLILIINDIANLIYSDQNLDPKIKRLEELTDATCKYLLPIVNHFKGLTIEEKQNYRKSYGSAGRTEYWHKLQQIINKEMPEFNPQTMQRHLLDRAQKLNDSAIKFIREIEKHLNKVIKEKLIDHYSERTWWKKGVPDKVYLDAEKLAATKNREIEDETKEVEPWNCLHIIDYRDIIKHNKNWLLPEFTRPGEEQFKSDDKTNWLFTFNNIRNENVHSWKGSEDEVHFLEGLYTWLLKDEGEGEE